jgi:hypothetical protein
MGVVDTVVEDTATGDQHLVTVDMHRQQVALLMERVLPLDSLNTEVLHPVLILNCGPGSLL